MIQIDIDMPTDCASCWIRQNMGCKIANASGWLNNRRDDKCPLKEQEAVVRCKDCLYCVKEPNGELYCDILAVGYEPLGSKKVSADWFCADGERR